MQTVGKIFELLKNEDFVLWVTNPREESDHYWTKWITANPDRKQDVAMARQFILSSKKRAVEKLPEETYNEILEKIVDHAREKKDVKRVILWKPLSVAASVAMIFVSIFVFWKPEVDAKVEENNVIVTDIQKEAPRGQRITTKLPDGTLVTLNAGSKITFPEKFNEDTRNVSLVGEAFFKVQRDESKPFTIATGNINIRVLGTSFNVRSFQNERNMQVAVEEGKVAVTENITQEGVALSQLEMVSVSINDGAIHKENISDKTVIFGWRDGDLVFKEQKLETIIQSLSRWYDVEFDIQQANKSEKLISATFRNASLKEVMESLSHIQHFNYQINGKTVTIE